ncbi:unnamed protein product [Sphacelaria rigidula]
MKLKEERAAAKCVACCRTPKTELWRAGKKIRLMQELPCCRCNQIVARQIVERSPMRRPYRSPGTSERTRAPTFSGMVFTSDRSKDLPDVHGTKGAAGWQGMAFDGRKCGRWDGADEVML